MRTAAWSLPNVVEALPHPTPRHECVCGCFRTGMSDHEAQVIHDMLKECKPRGMLLELGRRFDCSLLQALLIDAGYVSWSLVLNSNGWCDIDRKSKFLVAFRSDIKRCFSEFPFPEEVKYGAISAITVGVKGDCMDLGIEPSRALVGLPKEYDLTDICQRRILSEPNVEVVRVIGAEMYDWMRPPHIPVRTAKNRFGGATKSPKTKK